MVIKYILNCFTPLPTKNNTLSSFIVVFFSPTTVCFLLIMILKGLVFERLPHLTISQPKQNLLYIRRDVFLNLNFGNQHYQMENDYLRTAHFHIFLHSFHYDFQQYVVA